MLLKHSIVWPCNSTSLERGKWKITNRSACTQTRVLHFYQILSFLPKPVLIKLFDSGDGQRAAQWQNGFVSGVHITVLSILCTLHTSSIENNPYRQVPFLFRSFILLEEPQISVIALRAIDYNAEPYFKLYSVMYLQKGFIFSILCTEFLVMRNK